ncbi:hypothetical protein PoB_007488500 [Plakobranchus ocellatus]|uniref:Uncharacterized protein n=1 Tax=Plakobranchus ocellatus TaxID=259542 RepID=A0AAV4DWI0_9GAST|nr:hypothetical protein PoB_007488500 [Plakobranchus ocellatus]
MRAQTVPNTRPEKVHKAKITRKWTGLWDTNKHASAFKKDLSNFFFFNSQSQQGDFILADLPSGQGTGGGARTRDRKAPADLRADSLSTVLPTPSLLKMRT